MKFPAWILAGVLLLPATGLCQRRVDPSRMYERAYLVLPMTGKGTLADPRRPLYMPAQQEMNPADRTGIIAFHHQLSDDGKLALVEVVAAKRAALTALTSRARAEKTQLTGVQVFDDPPPRGMMPNGRSNSCAKTSTSRVSGWWRNESPGPDSHRTGRRNRQRIRRIHLLLH